MVKKYDFNTAQINEGYIFIVIDMHTYCSPSYDIEYYTPGEKYWKYLDINKDFNGMFSFEGSYWCYLDDMLKASNLPPTE